jgi:EAL domain-containing protein (putative c-di-GMP-specific phosphodiesterase class I)
LPQAIENDELLLHFQPAVDVRTGRPLRAEALVRWRHPELGFVSPVEFVGLAEATGLVRTMTRWVALNAVMTARAWIDAGLSVGVAINLSAHDLATDGFADWLHTLLDTHGVPHSRLSVEVTESELMEDLDRAIETLRDLRAGGVRVAIDDFGTGYASLAYLGNLPVDEVKIDRSFVMAMNASPSDAMIVRSTIDLCHNLGYQVVAEGVEDDKTLTRLLHMGCDVAQGFHTGRPMEHEQFVAWMGAHARLASTITISGPDDLRAGRPADRTT